MMKSTYMALALLLNASPVFAEKAQPLAKLELNTVTQSGEDCRMVFTAQAPHALDALVVETVLFDAKGGVSLLTLFDFDSLPAAGLRVRQFDIPATQCGGISRVLFNGVTQCEGAGCAAPLAVGSRIDAIEVLK